MLLLTLLLSMHWRSEPLEVSPIGHRASTMLENIAKPSLIATQAEFDELRRAAQLSSGAYSACQGRAFDVTITRQLNNFGTDTQVCPQLVRYHYERLISTQGYIGYSTSRRRITVVFRGSTTVQDILNDVNIDLVTPRLSGVNFPTGTRVIEGVFDPYSSVHDTVIREVRSLIQRFPDYTLESTGHSLGGSLTYLSYIALAQNFPDKSITSNALAAFPIGNDVFARFGQSQDGLLRRGNNVADGVPVWFYLPLVSGEKGHANE